MVRVSSTVRMLSLLDEQVPEVDASRANQALRMSAVADMVVNMNSRRLTPAASKARARAGVRLSSSADETSTNLKEASTAGLNSDDGGGGGGGNNDGGGGSRNGSGGDDDIVTGAKVSSPAAAATGHTQAAAADTATAR
jgi:hypothetical protein